MFEASVNRGIGAEGSGWVSGAILVIASLTEVNACFAASGNANFCLTRRDRSVSG